MKILNQIKKTLCLLTIISLPVSAIADVSVLQKNLDQNARAELKNLNSTIEKDPTLRKTMKLLKEEIDALAQKPLTLPQMKIAHDALLNKYKSDLQKLFKLANFNSDQYFKRQELLLNQYNLKYKQKFQLTRRGTLSFQLSEGPQEAPATESAEINLTAPFPLVENQPQEGDVFVDASEGKLRINSRTGMIGNTTDVGGLAHFFRLPSRVERIRVSARLPEVFSAVSIVSLYGAGAAHVRVHYVIEGESGVLCRSKRTMDSLHGYFIDFTSLTKTSSIVLSCEINAPPAGQDIVVKLIGESHADSFAAYTSGTIFFKPESIRVRLNPAQ